jgi:hypothetical protein
MPATCPSHLIIHPPWFCHPYMQPAIQITQFYLRSFIKAPALSPSQVQILSSAPPLYIFKFKIYKEDRQCTYNVTFMRVRETLLPWKSNKYYIFVCACTRENVSNRARVRVCNLTYPACNAHALACHFFCLWFHDIFWHYLIHGSIFGQNLLNTKMCNMIFSTAFV